MFEKVVKAIQERYPTARDLQRALESGEVDLGEELGKCESTQLFDSTEPSSTTH